MTLNALPIFFLLTIGFASVSCSKDKDMEDDPGTIANSDTTIKTKDAFPGLTFTNPVEMKQIPGDSSRFFVVEQAGVIRVFQNNAAATTSTVFLDIQNKVQDGGERGLLGLAFHPDFKTNGYFYVNYTAGSPLKTVIARYKAASPAAERADPSSEAVLFTFNQPYDNHNGGSLQFGKDSFLYIATGDGGSGGDPQNNAQNRKSMLGKILRVDVDGTSKGNYGIPSDNPYPVGNNDGFLPEIYAYGLRNPWRISFDMDNDRLFAGDVGQNKREEIDLITKGGNYGWRLKEGVDCYDPASNCNAAGLIEPIHDYNQNNGDRSITGGYVYRGNAIKSLEGKYIYGDFASGRIWALELDGDQKKSNAILFENKGAVSSFAQDISGEVYYLNYGEGKIMKLVNGNLN
ncbi:PQQ-dependent sugar dehydrogenase [Dyadobacter fanqingshengii]|uniref:PQQ-dependent sugar dehydrogenase n=1 Tax=Dyadobacter fanqingshengii TaxID=2906443 RepID=A0A9X1PGG5_9BACT|nr:PQQ-dependent sugar dehydrogenase [Dyadobacter fanqingshengii]MCF0043283.1 PQQ-dependent sugar dehydrogenase [Dyadobacter fanqingshengii]USJ35756.1 PQQ-dependent sugar dehydrogenase [Dyadobacter fanqingshengii]